MLIREQNKKKGETNTMLTIYMFSVIFYYVLLVLLFFYETIKMFMIILLKIKLPTSNQGKTSKELMKVYPIFLKKMHSYQLNIAR